MRDKAKTPDGKRAGGDGNRSGVDAPAAGTGSDPASLLEKSLGIVNQHLTGLQGELQSGEKLDHTDASALAKIVGALRGVKRDADEDDDGDNADPDKIMSDLADAIGVDKMRRWVNGNR